MGFLNFMRKEQPRQRETSVFEDIDAGKMAQREMNKAKAEAVPDKLAQLKKTHAVLQKEYEYNKAVKTEKKAIFDLRTAPIREGLQSLKSFSKKAKTRIEKNKKTHVGLNFKAVPQQSFEGFKEPQGESEGDRVRRAMGLR
jgi:hypothetical protein